MKRYKFNYKGRNYDIKPVLLDPESNRYPRKKKKKLKAQFSFVIFCDNK